MKNKTKVLSYVMAIAFVITFASSSMAFGIDFGYKSENYFDYDRHLDPNQFEAYDYFQIEDSDEPNNELSLEIEKEVTFEKSDELRDDDYLDRSRDSITENFEDEHDILEISDENIPEGVSSTEPIKVSSFEDLKNELKKVDVQRYLRVDNGKHLVLKNNNYKLESDITIDLADAYFSDKHDYIQTGIMSFGNSVNDEHQTADDSEFIFDGNGHTITIKPEQGKEALPLFGLIISGKTQIKNLDLVIDGDVVGYPFADLISSMQSKDEQGYTIANGLVENITVNVNGSVVPQVLPWDENSNRWSILLNNHFIGNFIGSMATGFGVKVNRTNLNNIKVNIAGDIGSSQATNLDDTYKQMLAEGKNYSAGAFGFLWCSDDADYYKDETGDNVWTKTRTELFKNGNYKVLRECGYIENVDINIGGSIYATGYDNAYAAGFMDSSDNSWVDNVNIEIDGDIKTVLLGGTEGNSLYGNGQMETSYAVGFAESIMNLTNSKLSVNNLIMDVSDDYQKKVNGNTQNLVTSLCGIGYDSGAGNLIRLVNNTVNIREKMEAKTSINLIANSGFYNTWNSNSKDGVNWAHFFEDNEITIGEIDLKQNSNYALQYYGLGEKFRTGTLSDREVKEGYKPLEEVSAKNNTLNVGKLTLTNQGGYSKVYPSFFNAANAKNNDISYGDITVVSRDGVFSGFGNIINDEPRENNGINEITENNKLDLGDITIAGINFQTISLGASNIDSNKTMKNNKIKAGDVIVKLGGFNDQGQLAHQNEKTLYFGGLSYYNKGLIEDNHIFVKDIDILNTSTTYSGLGAAFNKGEMKDSTVLVDKDVKIGSVGKLYEGLFTGYSKGGDFANCHAQINGITSLGVPQGVGRYFGSFGGWLANTDVQNSSALMFNGYSPFAYYMDGGSLDGVANYSDEGNWKFMSGLLATSNQNNKPTIKNSTYIVNKVFEYTDNEGINQKQNNEDSIVYRDDNVSSDTTNNYIVIVGEEGEDEYNRVAYKLEKRKATEDEMGPSVPEVWAKGKDAKPVGKINIAKRTFQDKYWGDHASEYKTGKDEKEFHYMNENPDNLKIISYGRFKDIVESSGAISDKASLENYYNRHVGLRVADGPIFDLLGIKGYPIVEEQEPEPEPEPEPQPEPYDPGYRYDPSPDYLNEKSEPERRDLDVYRWYMEGNENNEFMPKKGITRAEMAQIFARALSYDGYKTYGDYNPYPDVETNKWYYQAILTTTEAGVFKGTDMGTFEPEREITQAELIATISRFQKLINKEGNAFEMKFDHWARPEVQAAYEEKWLELYKDGRANFNADAVITREEVATILNKAFGRPIDKKYINDMQANIKDVEKTLKTFKDIDKDMWSYYEIITAANTYAVKYKDKERTDYEWYNHAIEDDGPSMPVEKVRWYKGLLNNDKYIDHLYQIKFQREMRRY